MASPLDDPGVYDYAVVARNVSPPIDEDGIEGFGIVYKIDKKEPDGAAGGVSTFKGQKLAEGSIRFAMYTQEDFDAWDIIFPLLKIKKDAKEAVEVIHPDLLEMGFKDFLVEEIGRREGGWAGDKSTRTVRFSAFAPPKPASGTPTKTNTGGYTAEEHIESIPVIDAADAYIAELTAEAAAP